MKLRTDFGHTNGQFVETLDEMTMILVPRQIESSGRESFANAILGESRIMLEARDHMKAPSYSLRVVTWLFLSVVSATEIMSQDHEGMEVHGTAYQD